MTFKRTNISSYVEVKLTEHGKRVLEDRHKKFWANTGLCPSYCHPAEDIDGYSRWQLWVLMQDFGPHIGLAKEPMFECDVFVDVYD